MPRSVNTVAGRAGVVALVMILTGCASATPSSHAPPPVPRAVSSNDAATPVDSGTSPSPRLPDPAPSRTTPAVRATTPRPSPPRANQSPAIRSVSSVPGQVNPLDCAPPDPPERPEIIVEVADPDGPVDATVIRLQYSSGSGYHGDVRMRFDAKRKAFVYTLPPVTRAAVGNDARTIAISVQVQSSTARPLSHWIPFKGYCMGPIGNG